MAASWVSRPLRASAARAEAVRAALRTAWLRLSHVGVRIGPLTRVGPGLILAVTDGATLSVGADCRIGNGCRIVVKRGALAIGDHCFIGDACTICANESISIGQDVLIAERVSIRDQDHGIDGRGPIHAQPMQTAPIVIGAGAWIGAGAVVLRGAWIGEGAVIGANAVVRGVIPDRAVAAGVPARVLRQRSAC